MVIKMNQFGTSLTTRVAGEKAYNLIKNIIDSTDEIIVFDFDGVNLVTNSFADQVFGVLTIELGLDVLKSSTTFKNVKPIWAKVIRRAIDFRSQYTLA